MAKILFISGIEVFPPLSGGQLRSSNLAKAIAKNNNVTIYSLTGRKKDYLKFRKSSEIKIENNLTEYTNRNPIWGFIQFIFYQLKLPPIWITFLSNYYLPKKLKKLIDVNEIIILDFPFLHPIFNKYPNKIKILNTHNAEFNLYSNKILSQLVKNIEINSMKETDKIIFCSDNDQKHFPQLITEKKSIIIPNGIDIEIYQKRDEVKNNQLKKQLKIQEEDHVFIFTGSKYGPNIEAVKKLKQFTQENESFLTQNKIKILIVGSVGDEPLTTNSLIITGRVDSVVPYLQISHYALNNIETGSGTNVKMFEYIAANLILVSSNFGARGFNLLKNEDYIDIEDNYLRAFTSSINMSRTQKQNMLLSAFNKNKTLLSMENHVKELI